MNYNTKKDWDNEIHYIYFLKDIDKNVVFYVGVTSRPKVRFIEHHNKYISWKNFSMEIVCKFYDRTLAEDYEYYLIDKLLNNGVELLNKKTKL